VQFIHVFDRGADDFEVFCHLRANQADWVVRVRSLTRKIITPAGQPFPLREHLPALPLVGSYRLELRARPQQPARSAQLEVRSGSIALPLPAHKSPYVKARGPEPIDVSVVWVREVNAPAGTKPIEWVLYTSLPVQTFNDAWQVIEYYEERWLIEEYHKALKTGCRVEDRELRSAKRLEAVVGLMSIVAVRLLQLKSVAHHEPERLAKTVVPREWLKMLELARKKPRARGELTVSQFYRELAQLGGFLGRKSDGQPGWITIWRGWEKLNLLVQAARLLEKSG
jgi:hypothetical protein